jgi:hypothetical protein
VKYSVYLLGKSKRSQKREQNSVRCPNCDKPCKNERGIKQHRSSGGCQAYRQKRTNHDYVTPKKHMSPTLSSHVVRLGVSCEESKVDKKMLKDNQHDIQGGKTAGGERVDEQENDDDDDVNSTTDLIDEDGK